MSNPSSPPEPDFNRPPESIEAAELAQAAKSLLASPHVTAPAVPIATEQNLGTPVMPLGQIGRYAIKYKISETPTGGVYAAHDPLLSRLIAIKTYNTPRDESQYSQFKAQFLKQAGAAAGLSHPNIVNIFDVDISHGQAYVAMELLKGKSLAQMRLEDWRPNHSQAALIVRRIADALAYAHSRGVVHGNIKPANILMLSSTQPRVLDFGLAGLTRTHKGPNQGNPNRKQRQVISSGSPQYMAPEQIRQKPIDRRTDVFALGVLLYQLLTHQNPFSGSTPEEITRSVLKNAPLTAHTLNPDIPKNLSDIAARAMNTDIAHRYRSARAMSRELQQWLGRQDNAVEGLATFTPAARRRRPALLIGILGLASLVLMFTMTWVSWPSRQDTPPSVQTVAATPKLKAPAPPPSHKPDSAPAAHLSDPASSSLLPPTASPLIPILTPGLELVAPVAPPTEVIQPRIAIYIPPPVPSAPSPPRPSINAVQRSAREAANEPQASKAQQPQHPPQPAHGIVRIAVTPWGQIEVDGTSAGIAPPLNELRLSEGQHQITIRNGDHPPYTATVKVTPGQPFFIKHRFGS